MQRMRFGLVLGALVPSFLLASACSGPLYQLPEPLAVEQARDISMDRAAERERDAARFVDARRAMLGLYESLGAEDWDAAVAHLSQETRVLLSAGGEGDAATTLATGELVLGGTLYSFAPIDLLLMDAPQEMLDVLPGAQDVETDRRKVIHLMRQDGETRAVVMILEGDAWRVHVPAMPRERVTSSRL